MVDVKRSFGLVLAIVLGLVLLLSINVISNNVLRSARFDLTANQQYTLNKGTLNILKALDEPIRLQFFYSEGLASAYPQFRVYGQRVKDLLSEYEVRSKGKLHLSFVNPEPFTEDEDDAVALGITGVPTESGDKLYFGLAGTNSIDGRETIPFFSIEREPYLEFDLTSLIYELSRGDKPVLGILSTIPLEFGVGGPMAAAQGQAQPYVIYDQLLTGFNVRNLEQDLTSIPEEVETLMLVHPAGLSSQTLYAVDQFVLAGGHALIFVDPLSEMVQAPSPMGMPAPSGPPNFSSLDPLFDAWGISYSSQDVVADMNRALRVQAGGGAVVDYIVWLGLQSDNFDSADLVTAELQSLQLGSAGALLKQDGSSTTFAPLITSSSNSMLVDRDEVEMGFNPNDLILKFKPTAETYVIAARISGDAASAYPDGRPDPEEDDSSEEQLEPDEEAEEDAESEASPREHLVNSEGPINVIVVADTDILDDRFWINVQDFLGQKMLLPTADNGTMVVNAVENLMGSSDLISLRSRGRDYRPLTAIENLRRQANARFLERESLLEQQLAATEQRLTELRTKTSEGDGSGELGATVITEEEQREIDQFTQDYLSIRRDLREVQRDLRRDIEALQNVVRFANIGLMPLVIGVFAIFLALSRRNNRRRARQQGN